MNKLEIDYCVLRNYENLPYSTSGHDIDILVESSQAKKAIDTIISIIKNNKGRLISIIQSFLVTDLAFCIQNNDHWWGIRFDIMEYGDMYQKLESDSAYFEGGYVRKDWRGQGLFPKFKAEINKMLYKKGKKIVHSHIAAKTRQIASLKAASKAGGIPNYWISRVNINLPFFRSSTFVRHDIKRSDFSKFPLSIFYTAKGPCEYTQ